jgi:hypothetical protein
MKGGDEMPEREPDGTTIEYDEIPVDGDRVERLLRELFTDHWSAITVGPILEGAAFEIRFTAPPALAMLDGYLTVDTGAWHFHLCVGDHRGAPASVARIRRVARAAFFRSSDGTCVPETWGLRLWNGRSDQMITIFFPNPYYDERTERRQEPDWTKTELWESFRRRYAATEAVPTS